MRVSWLENMVKEGSISEAARDEIYRDRDLLVKMASESMGMGTNRPEIDPRVKKVVEGIVQMMVPMGISKAMGVLANRRDGIQQLKSIKDNRQSILNMPDFAEKQDKALARFDELVDLAPTVAANQGLATRLVAARMNDGFTDADVTNIALMQSSMTPDYRQSNSISNKYKDEMSKNASAERLGDMYADVYMLHKQASRGKGISNTNELWRALKTTALVSSVPLLAGIGTGVVQQRSLKRSKEQLQEKLDESFSKALRMAGENDAIKNDKAKARSAFETLVHFAPHVASNPSAAKSFMNKIVEYDGVDISSIKELSEIERNLGQANKDPNFLQSFRSGAEATGLQRIVAGGVSEAIKPTQSQVGNYLAGTN